jgi:hypothetical protein
MLDFLARRLQQHTERALNYDTMHVSGEHHRFEELLRQLDDNLAVLD